MNDAIALIGFAGLAAGLWWIHPPSALVICGGLLLALGAAGALAERREQAKRRVLARIKRLKMLGPAAEEYE